MRLRSPAEWTQVLDSGEASRHKHLRFVLIWVRTSGTPSGEARKGKGSVSRNVDSPCEYRVSLILGRDAQGPSTPRTAGAVGIDCAAGAFLVRGKKGDSFRDLRF